MYVLSVHLCSLVIWLMCFLIRFLRKDKQSALILITFSLIVYFIRWVSTIIFVLHFALLSTFSSASCYQSVFGGIMTVRQQLTCRGSTCS
jgi:hypothetical protein